MCKRGIYSLLLSLTNERRRRRLNPSGVHGRAIVMELTHLRLNKLATNLQHYTRTSNPLQMRKHLTRINRRTHLRDIPFYTDQAFIFITYCTKNICLDAPPLSQSALGQGVRAYGITNGRNLCSCFWRIQIICGVLIFLAPVFHNCAEDAYIYVGACERKATERPPRHLVNLPVVRRDHRHGAVLHCEDKVASYAQLVVTCVSTLEQDARFFLCLPLGTLYVVLAILTMSLRKGPQATATAMNQQHFSAPVDTDAPIHSHVLGCVTLKGAGHAHFLRTGGGPSVPPTQAPQF